MADNTTLNAGSGGDVIASDDIGGVKYQRTKVVAGADGVATDVGIGGGTEATALRVTIASDSTGVVSIDDNGSSITVDGTVELGATSLAALESLTTITTVTTVGAVTGITNALPAGTNNIGDVDVLSVVPGTGATSLGKAEDAAHASGDTGVMFLTVRANTAAATSGTDGDYQPAISDTNGRLHVIEPSAAAALTALQVIDNAVAVDDAAFTVATGSGHPIMGVVTTDQVDSGDAGVLAMTTRRALHTVVTNSSGTVIDPQADDAAFTAGTSLVSVIAGIATSDSVDSGDAGAIAMTLTRRMHVTPKADTSGGAPSHHRNIDANAETEVKSSAGQLYWLHAMNMTAAVAYIHLYDNTAAGVTPGTTTPTYTFPLATQGDTNGAGCMFNFGPVGQQFGTGITYVVTTTLDGAAGDPGTNGVFVNLGYA